MKPVSGCSIAATEPVISAAYCRHIDTMDCVSLPLDAVNILLYYIPIINYHQKATIQPANFTTIVYNRTRWNCKHGDIKRLCAVFSIEIAIFSNREDERQIL